MSRRLIAAITSCLSLVLLGAGVTPAAAQLTQLGATQAATGHTSVIHGIAYAARHDVYLTVYEAPDGIRGRFVNAAGTAVGAVFSIAAVGQQAIVYANKPMVAYSTDTADDTFFVMYATDFGKAPDAQPGAWIQRVSFTGTGGARLGNPIQVGDGGWEIPNDIIYNPATRQFVAVWERFFSEGPDVMARYFNADGTAATGIINVSNANRGQGAAKAAVDWERNRILIAYQGLHPNSPVNPEILGLWAKVLDGTTGALLTTLIQVQSGFTIEAMPVFMPEVDGFLVTWTGFNPGRDVVGRYVSSADGAVGASPNPVYIIAGSARQEGAPMGMYDAISRRILMGIQSSGGCPNETCPYLDGAILDPQGVVLSSFTGLSSAVPSATGGTFYPDVAPGEGGQFGFSYTLNYSSVYVERVGLPAASTPGPQFGGGTPTVGLTTSPTSLSFSVSKNGATLGSVTPRSVSLTFSTGTTGAWAATTTAPWLQLASASGTGDGSFTVTVINPSNVIASQTSLSGAIVITAATAPNAPLTIPVTVAVSSTNTSGGTLSQQGATQLATGHTAVVHGIAYSPRHDVYLTVYESPNGVRGRFMNTAGQPVGDVFAIATAPGQATSYANKPMVAYSHDTADDVFFVMYGSDYTKAADAVPSTWIQRVSFTGTGGARVGNPIAVGDGGWEIPNDIVYNPASRQFVAVWERFFGSGPDVMVRFFNADGTAGTGIVNVSAGNNGQGAAKAAVDWERNRILIAYQGLHPNSPVNPEVLGLWAKIVDGVSGAVLTGLLQTQAGFTIEAMPVFLPEVDGFLVTWTGFNPGRDVLGRYVSSLDASLGAMPNPVYTIAGSARSEGAPMGMYDAISRRVLMAVQSSGGCPNDTCPFVDGAILTGDGAVTSSFTGLSTVAPSATGGSFYPDVAVGEGGQFGLSYSLNYFSIYNDRIVLSAADAPGPQFGTPTTPVVGATMAPSSLAFSIIKAGAQINAGNPASVAVTFSTGTGGVWTAASSVPWLQVSSATGSGDGQFIVRVINPSNVIGSQTLLSGSIILTAASAPNSPVTLPVSVNVVTVFLPSAVPFGQVDTPLQGAVGVQGAIAITGWALDDTGVTSVNIYRNCFAFDVQAACQTILGNRVVFLGQAVFLPGARSDVEAAYPVYPNADRAGWGIQILTNQLPHVGNGQTTGGHGAITFYAIATDTVGNVKVLGRSSSSASGDFSTPTSVTLANESIAKPFGSLDTPALGATVSGSIPNFGWALTPDDDAVVGNVDKVVPTDGSTVTVYIDGVARATVTYNQCRGNAGNPVPPTAFCDDDIANTFGNTAPLAALTPRSSNPTRYRNLDAGRGAIGSYVLDTRTLSNGLHTIAWAVMDSAGRTEGIGSRFFTVANAATDMVPADALAKVGGVMPSPAAADADGTVARAPEGRDGVWGRTGFDPRVPWIEMTPDSDGRRTVRLDEMGRLELWLGASIESAFVVAPGTKAALRALPTGSAVDGPQFTWAPGPGHVGTYQLAFMRGGERIDVFVTIAPPAGVRDDEPAIRMTLDDVRSPECGVRSAELARRSLGEGGCGVRVSGTAFDPQAAIGSGVEAVHIWARHNDGRLVFLGEATLSGITFSLTAPLPTGTWDVTAYAWNRRTMRFEDARTGSVAVR
jgi:hypothetical protein